MSRAYQQGVIHAGLGERSFADDEAAMVAQLDAPARGPIAAQVAAAMARWEAQPVCERCEIEGAEWVHAVSGLLCDTCRDRVADDTPTEIECLAFLGECTRWEPS